MPELPEVEYARTLVESHCLRETIAKCLALESGGGNRHGMFDDIVINEDATADTITSALEGRTIMAVKRRGKQLWFELDNPPHPLFHFGMTGAFIVKGYEPMKYWSFKVSKDVWPPKFTKLELQMTNGKRLALTDPRRLSRVKLRESPELEPPISNLGPDPITHPISLGAFSAKLAKIAAPIKAALLAQDRVVSGVGNWIADEVCFQASVHPGAACNTLSLDQVLSVHRSLLSVCSIAVDANADYNLFPKDWLFHHRWGKGKGSDGAPCVSSGHCITFETVGGRTTAVVLDLQKRGLLSGGGEAKYNSTVKSQRKGSTKVKGKGKAGGTGRGNAKAVKELSEVNTASGTVSGVSIDGNDDGQGGKDEELFGRAAVQGGRGEGRDGDMVAPEMVKCEDEAVDRKRGKVDIKKLGIKNGKRSKNVMKQEDSAGCGDIKVRATVLPGLESTGGTTMWRGSRSNCVKNSVTDVPLTISESETNPPQRNSLSRRGGKSAVVALMVTGKKRGRAPPSAPERVCDPSHPSEVKALSGDGRGQKRRSVRISRASIRPVYT